MLHDTFGTNLRLTEIQSGIGRMQLRNIKTGKIRERNANILIDNLKKLLVRYPPTKKT